MSLRTRADQLTQPGAGATGWRGAFVVIGLLVALSGCLSTPIPKLQPDVPDAWLEARRHPGVPVDLQRWWHAFGSAELDALVETALRQEPGLRAARARLAAARILAPHALDPLRPTLRALTNDQIDPDASASFFVAGFDATWELGLFGRAEAMRRRSEAALKTAQADEAAARVSLVAEVVRDWLQLRTSNARCAALGEMLAARNERAGLVAKRVALGLAAASDSAAARMEVADARGELANAQRDAASWRHALAAMVGRSEPDPAWSASQDVPSPGGLALSSVPADLVRARPDVDRSEAAVLAAAAELGLARADRYPSIGIGGSLHWSTSLTAHRDTPSNEAIAGVGPVVEIPLFDWGLRAAQQHARAQDLQAAVYAYRATVLAAVAEAETSLAAVEAARAREAQARLAETDGASLARAARTRQQLRLASRIDVLDAGLKLMQRRLDRLDATSAADLGYVALFKALGGASVEPALPDDARPGRDKG